MAGVFVGWEEKSESKDSKFLKIETKTKIRFLTKAIKYNKVWPSGPKDHYLAGIMAEGHDGVMFLELKQAVREAIKDYAEETGIEPDGVDAPSFTIWHNGQAGLAKRWSCVAGNKMIKYPESVDRKKLENDLFDFASLLEKPKAA